MLLKLDKNQAFKFASLQGETAGRLLAKNLIDEPSTLILWTEKKLYFKSKAIFSILRLLGGYYKVFLIFMLLPASINDNFYNFIANNRYTFFGGKNICRNPLKNESKRFLK